jgi:hypothetical protein
MTFHFGDRNFKLLVENDHAMSFISSFLDLSLLAIITVKSNAITINSGNPTKLMLTNSYK